MRTEAQRRVEEIRKLQPYECVHPGIGRPNRHQRRANDISMKQQMKKVMKTIKRKAAKDAKNQLITELNSGSQEENTSQEINPRPEG